MSSESATDQYQVSITGSLNGLAVGNFTSGDGWTDEFAIAFAQALNGLQWPGGNAFSITKSHIDTTQSQLDLTQNPPAFT